MAFLQLPQGQAKTPAYLTSNSVSSKQLIHPAKDEADSISQTFPKNGFGMNFLGRNVTTGLLDRFTRDHLIDHRSGFLRTGYVQQEYGRIFPTETPEHPLPGQTIAPTASYYLRIFEDYTGKEMFRLTAKLDYSKFRSSEAFLDPANYYEFVREHTFQVSQSLSQALNLIPKFFFAGLLPGVFMSTDVNVVGFLDNNARPTEQESKAANEGFDKDKNKFFKETILKEVVGQAQSKLTNVGIYSPELYSPGTESFVIEKPNKQQALSNGEAIKKGYFRKDNEQQKSHENINRFSSLVALSRAIKEKAESMVNIESPRNMAFYDPYKEGKQTDGQLSRTTTYDALTCVLNPYDLSDLDSGLTSTSPYGNGVAEIDSLRAKGVRFYPQETVLPGNFVILEYGLFAIMRIFQESYHLNFNGVNSEQYGGHLFGKIYINKFKCFYKGVPTKFVPAQDYLSHDYKALSIS